jgi:hypothetical protein
MKDYQIKDTILRYMSERSGMGNTAKIHREHYIDHDSILAMAKELEEQGYVKSKPTVDFKTEHATFLTLESKGKHFIKKGRTFKSIWLRTAYLNIPNWSWPVIAVFTVITFIVTQNGCNKQRSQEQSPSGNQASPQSKTNE